MHSNHRTSTLKSFLFTGGETEIPRRAVNYLKSYRKSGQRPGQLMHSKERGDGKANLHGEKGRKQPLDQNKRGVLPGVLLPPSHGSPAETM